MAGKTSPLQYEGFSLPIVLGNRSDDGAVIVEGYSSDENCSKSKRQICDVHKLARTRTTSSCPCSFHHARLSGAKMGRKNASLSTLELISLNTFPLRSFHSRQASGRTEFSFVYFSSSTYNTRYATGNRTTDTLDSCAIYNCMPGIRITPHWQTGNSSPTFCSLVFPVGLPS